MEVTSIYEVTNFKDNKTYEEAVNGAGEEAIKYLRTQYPRYTKFILKGFEINGKFKPLKIQ